MATSYGPGTGYQSYGGGDNWVDPSIEAQRLAAEKAQAEYTAKHAMSREDFIKKYAIGEGGTFVANDKGGNAASEVAGQSVAEYYDKYLGPDAKKTYTLGHGADNDTTEEQITWGGGKYRDAHPYFDAYDNVNPHPESQLGNGLEEFVKQARPFAAMAAMGMGAAALGGWSAGATTAAAATPASGLAGMVGMKSGMAATALNSGALNAGITALRGGSLEDSLKSGLTAAALSPVGGWAKGVVGEATAGLGKGISNAIASTAAGAATGAAGAALTGKDIGKGATTGLIAGGIQSFGNAVGGWAKQETGSDLVGMAASAGTKAVLGKKQNNLSLLGSLVDGGIEAFGKRTKSGVKLSDGTTV
jgi:hypothetical protein